MAPQLHETRMGRILYEVTLPRIADALEKLTEQLAANQQVQAPVQDQSGQTESGPTGDNLCSFVDPYVTVPVPDLGISVQVKLESEGVVVDVWKDDEVIATTWKLYDEMSNPEVKEDDELDTYIMTDQPEECRKCGTRTEILREENEYQIHLCKKCNYRYKLIEDYEFQSKVSKKVNMNKIIIDPHYCTREEYQELKDYLTEKTWDWQEISSGEENSEKDGE